MPLLRRDHGADQTRYLRRRGISLITNTTSSATATTWLRSPSAGSAFGTPTAIEIAPGEDDALILAAVVCIDQMSHD
jgi:hypothetical protein